MYEAYDAETGEFYRTDNRFDLDDHFYSNSGAGQCGICGGPKREEEIAMIDRKTNTLTMLTHIYCNRCDKTVA